MSTLLGIRQDFIKRSGREDLAKTASAKYDTDNGADFFIKGGSLDLDLEQDNIMSMADHNKDLTADDYDIQLSYCRNVHEVFYINSDGEKLKLTPITHGEMIDDYPKLGSTDSSTPLYWAQYTTRRVPDQESSGRDVDVISLMIMPPTDESITLVVVGKWYAYPLTVNADQNFWSVNFPHILVMAALRNLEGFYRNSQGYKDYDAIIQKLLIGIDKDLAEVDAARELQMEG